MQQGPFGSVYPLASSPPFLNESNMKIRSPSRQKLAPRAIGDLNDFILDISQNLKGLGESQSGVGKLRDDLEELPRQIEQLSQDMRSRLAFCAELGGDFQKADKKSEFLRKLDGERDFALNVKQNLFETRQLIDENKRFIETLFKMSSLRDCLSSVKNERDRKIMGKALTRTAINIEKVLQGQKELELAFERIVRLGIDKRIDLDSYSGNKSESVVQNSPPPVMDDPEDCFKTVMIESRTGALQDGEEREKKPEKNREKQESKKLSFNTTELLKFTLQLNEWAKWRPFTPSKIGSRLGVLSATAEKAAKVQVEVLLGERKRVEASAPYLGSQVDEKKVDQLWDLRADPPDGFQEGEESIRVPGEEQVCECSDCVQAGRASCSKCKNRRILKYQLCKTTYRVLRLEKIVYKGEIPLSLLSSAKGKCVYEGSLSASAPNVMVPGLETKSLQAASNAVSEECLREIGTFYQKVLEDARESAAGELSCRLIRSKIEVTEIPVQKVSCRLKNQPIKKEIFQFPLWIYGIEKKAHIGNVPRIWTRKASAYVAGIMLLGIPLGYLLGKFLQKVF